jgi:hypothetical protein
MMDFGMTGTAENNKILRRKQKGYVSGFIWVTWVMHYKIVTVFMFAACFAVAHLANPRCGKFFPANTLPPYVYFIKSAPGNSGAFGSYAYRSRASKRAILRNRNSSTEGVWMEFKFFFARFTCRFNHLVIVELRDVVGQFIFGISTDLPFRKTFTRTKVIIADSFTPWLCEFLLAIRTYEYMSLRLSSAFVRTIFRNSISRFSAFKGGIANGAIYDHSNSFARKYRALQYGESQG